MARFARRASAAPRDYRILVDLAVEPRFAVWAWWAQPVAAVVCLALYRRSLVLAAHSYGDLIYAAFALQRFDLHERCAGRHRPTAA